MSQYGPALPPHLQKLREASQEEDSKDADVPPTNKSHSSYGPALPPGFSRKRPHDGSPTTFSEKTQPSSSQEENPNLSYHDDDDEVIGPTPPQPGSEQEHAQSVARDLEARAQRMKDRLEGKDQPEVQGRETWMLELPPERTKNFGLGPRQFNKSNKDKPKGDRSGWTDTPEMKAKKARGELIEEPVPESAEKDEDVLAYLASLKRDQAMDKVAHQLRDKRGTKSLMEEHTQKRNQPRKGSSSSSSGPPMERRSFDRDIDLQANQFDNAQKERMLKKARQLNDRFSGGSQKYL